MVLLIFAVLQKTVESFFFDVSKLTIGFLQIKQKPSICPGYKPTKQQNICATKQNVFMCGLI